MGLVLLFLLAPLPALAQAPPSPPVPQSAAAQDTPEANKVVVRHYLQILSGGALDELDQVIGTDFVDRTPGTTAGVQGPEAIRASQRRARELFQDIRYSVADVLAEGDRVAARYTVRATQKGGGKSVEVLGVTLFRLAGGKIRETWIVNDQIELFRQLGFTLRPPDAPKPATPPRP
ncbi:MAG TPA: ester cyclase [Thermoanaerobaculia bacterium]